MLTNVSLIEAIWTVIALVGIYYSRPNLMDAWEDFRAYGGKWSMGWLTRPLKRAWARLRGRSVAPYVASGNGMMRLAVDNIRRESGNIAVFSLYVVIGVLAGLRPPSPTSSPFIAIILIFTELILIGNSRADRRSREYHKRYGIQGRDEKGRFTRRPRTSVRTASSAKSDGTSSRST